MQKYKEHACTLRDSLAQEENASLDSLPPSHDRDRGENLEAAGWNL